MEIKLNNHLIKIKLSMRKIIILSTMCIFVALFAGKTMAQPFSVANSDGKTIFYNIIGATTTVEVTDSVNGNTPYSYRGKLVIPDTVENNNTLYTVVSIGSSVFQGCTELDTVILPNTLTKIGNAAFDGCTKLSEIIIPDLVTTIESSAFFNCSKLALASIGNSVQTIGKSAFQGCNGLTEIIIPNSVITIDGSAFSACTKLSSLTIGNSVETIGDRAFSICPITSAFIPASVTKMGRGVFAECEKLTAIEVDANNTAYSSLEGVLFDKAQTQLVECPATKTGRYIIPNTVTAIANDAFYGCTKLTAVLIPNSVATIDELVFGNCFDLKEIYVKTTTPPQIQSTTFDDDHFQTLTVYVCGSVENYKTAAHWGNFKKIVEDCDANSIDDISFNYDCMIYPNPVRDNIRIMLPENIYQAVFTLYDMQGRTLIHQNITNQDIVSLNNFAEGIYLYNITTDKQNYQGKIVKR